jgi:hypothetical protein
MSKMSNFDCVCWTRNLPDDDERKYCKGKAKFTVFNYGPEPVGSFHFCSACLAYWKRCCEIVIIEELESKC